MKITMELLERWDACDEGKKMFVGQAESDGIKLVHALMEINRLDFANWLIVHQMSHAKKVKYAIFAAREVLEIFETKYPGDGRPRKAIEAAEAYISSPCAANAAAAAKAAEAVNAAYAAPAAVNAGYAGYAAANAGYAAAYAANAAVDAVDAVNAVNAVNAAVNAVDAGYAAQAEMKQKIIKH